MTGDNSGSSYVERVANLRIVNVVAARSDVISGRTLALDLSGAGSGGSGFTDDGVSFLSRISRLPTPPTGSCCDAGSSTDDATSVAADIGLSHCELAADVIVGVILSLFVVFAVAGNLLVIAAILTDRALRQTGNYFLVSLALADTLVAVAVMTFAIANDVLGRWPFGRVLCDVWVSADVMCSTASILNLCAVSLDRYIHIRSPLHYDRLVTHRRVLAAIAIVWALSALISFLPIQLGWHRRQLDSSTSVAEAAVGSSFNSSDINDSDRTSSSSAVVNASTGADRASPADTVDQQCLLELSPQYAVISSMVSFYLPCIAMTFFYFKLHRYARRHAETIKQAGRYIRAASFDEVPRSALATPSRPLRNPANGSGGGGSVDAGSGNTGGGGGGGGVLPSNGYHHRSHGGHHGASEHKAAITLGIIMGVFLLCWTPFFTINVVGAFCGDCIPPIVFSIFTWLGYLNSTMNPVIYSVFNRQFRDAFKRVLKLRRRGVGRRTDDGWSFPCCCCCGRGSAAGSGRSDWDEGTDVLQDSTAGTCPLRRRCESTAVLRAPPPSWSDGVPPNAILCTNNSSSLTITSNCGGGSGGLRDVIIGSGSRTTTNL